MTPRSERLELNHPGPEIIRHPHPGLYLVFEGGEGGGKSTQIRLLADWLEKHDFSFVTTREPGGTQRGLELRQLLLENLDGPPAERTEVFLFLADRSEHIAHVVEPSLKNGKVVVSDRSFYSNIAYQGAARGMGMDAVWQLNRMAVGDIVPDLVIFMDVEPEEGLRRRVNSYKTTGTIKVDRLDAESLEFHRHIYHAYKILQGKDPDRWFGVPSNLTPEEQSELVLARVAQEMVKKGMQMLEYSNGTETQRVATP